MSIPIHTKTYQFISNMCIITPHLFISLFIMITVKRYRRHDHLVKALVYGASGSGKTTFAGTAKDCIFASAENGLLSIADKDPLYVEIKSYNDILEFVKYLESEKFKQDFPNVKTVCVDSLTEISYICKHELEMKRGGQMEIKQWGELAMKLEDLARRIRDLPYHTVVICQEAELKDDQKTRKVVPSLDGRKASDRLPQFMDIVAYTFIDTDGSHRFVVGGNNQLVAKSREGYVTNETPMDFELWIDEVQQKAGEIQDEPIAKKVDIDPENKPADFNKKKRIKELWQKMGELGLFAMDQIEKTQRSMLLRDFKKDSTTKLTNAEAERHILAIDKYIQKKIDEPAEQDDLASKDIKQMEEIKDVKELETWFKKFLAAKPHPRRMEAVQSAYNNHRSSLSDAGDKKEDDQPEEEEKADITKELEMRQGLRLKKIPELRDEAKEAGIKSPTTKSKEDLIDALVSIYLSK